MVWITGLILGFVAAFVIVGMAISAPKYKGPVTANFNGKRFVNASGASAKGILEVMKWMTQRHQGAWNRTTTAGQRPKPPERSDATLVTFINHASFLIQVAGINILTDPVFSERVSPFNWIGPRRMRPPGIRFEDLPQIDYVLLTHNHYDHLDEETVLKLKKRFQPIFITPLGVDKFMLRLGIDKVVSLDWWQEMPLKAGLQVISVPAQHFSGRGILDRDATLWCGYVIKNEGGHIYFAGDTGYDQAIFSAIGESFSPIKLSLIPIGAYIPEWFMSPIHTSPAEAVQIHLDVNSEQSIAMHFGTFPLGDDGQQQPVDDLKKAVRAKGLPEGTFKALEEGQSYVSP